jgi:hypothetical protein
MKAVTFFPKAESNVIRSFGDVVLKGSCFLVAFCALAAYASAGDASNGRVRVHKKWNGVTIGNSTYDARTRNFEKPWPFGAASGAGGNSK